VKDCASCTWRRKVWTLKYGYDAYCLHPRSTDVTDGVAHSCRRAREMDKPCGPAGHLHSDNERRMGHVSPEQWRTTQ
jgi:hypothetical protein